MIPRFAPTYTYSDLLWSIKHCRRQEHENKLVAQLQDYYGVKHVFLVNSGKEAIMAILQVHDHPGGVIMPAYNCIEVPKAVIQAGYYPIFVDNDLDTLNINRDSLKSSLCNEATAIMPVHLFGIPWNIREVIAETNNADRIVIEDAAPAFGARLDGQLVGTFFDIAFISFHWTKSISGAGGGAILTNHEELAGKLDKLLAGAYPPNDNTRRFIESMFLKLATDKRRYRFVNYLRRQINGETMYEVVPHPSTNSHKPVQKISNFSTALILKQFERLDWNLNRRNQIAQLYSEGLSASNNLKIPKIPEGSLPSWIQFPLLAEDKMSFYKYMQRHGIDTTWSYRYACPDTYDQRVFPNAQKIAGSILSLPTCPTLSDYEVRNICSTANRYAH